MLGLLSPATTIALAVGLLSAVILLIVTFAFADANSRRFTRRLQEVTTRKGGAGAVVRSGEPQQRSLARRESATPGIDRLFRLLPRRDALVERLSRTGREISVGQYMLATIAVIIVITIGILVFAKFSLVPSLMFGIALGLFIPHWLIGRMGKKRIARFVALFPEAIDLMVRALRAGLPITEAIRSEERRVGKEVRSGWFG